MRYSNIFSRLWNASRYSLSGLIYALKNEQAFRCEAAVFFMISALIMFLNIPFNLSSVMIIAWLFVMCLELINSSVEKAFDLIDEHYRPEIKAGKDMLSASVFIAIICNVILWLNILLLL
ncbi:MAG: diacylglycerol kinase [Synergistaceae bacterium]|nr:diacylglycerol kinase [Synergistaceae bacterium]MBQ3448735.1 diacylglycerol kinase [Synergistaceae bacterium]MBQ3693216.1 diacylglycerol kinase [Synergistaceae bacterium]MBQ9629636.1 diacylglycerol kinase [Synergistaceae bacterium]MBR0250454.1 diacylglycerol kinase [Synergistaceae bacterium]